MKPEDCAIDKLRDGLRLRFDEVYPTDIDDLWSAVTEPHRLARWMTPYRGDLRLGGSWEALGDDGTPWGSGTITACEPPHSFATTWRAEEEPPTELRIVLEPTGGGTRLSLVHEVVTSIGYGAGWHVYLERLGDHVRGNPADFSEAAWQARFEQLHSRYRELVRDLAARHPS